MICPRCGYEIEIDRATLRTLDTRGCIVIRGKRQRVVKWDDIRPYKNAENVPVIVVREEKEVDHE